MSILESKFEVREVKWKPENDLMCNYWIIPSGDEYPEKNYDYIRVREILED